MIVVIALAASGLVLPSGMRHSVASDRIRAVRMMSLPSDADLFASLRKRTEAAKDTSAAPPPLGPDEVGADQMNPSDVTEYIMKSMTADAAGAGLKALLSFAVKFDDGKLEDMVGQVQPGSFSSPEALFEHFKQNPRYTTLTELSEWKLMGGPDFSNLTRNAAQKLLVRREGANWEDLFINMQLAEVAGDQGGLPTRRWLITSIYKQGTP